MNFVTAAIFRVQCNFVNVYMIAYRVHACIPNTFTESDVGGKSPLKWLVIINVDGCSVC